MAAELDTILFDMAVKTAGTLSSGFSEKVIDVAHRTAGHIVFDVRVDGDYRFQRLAGIRYPAGEVGILALTKNGQAMETCRVNAPWPASSSRWRPGVVCRCRRKPRSTFWDTPACWSPLSGTPAVFPARRRRPRWRRRI